MNWFIGPLKKYADFGGRARRKEYWMFSLFLIIFTYGLVIIDFSLGWVFAVPGGYIGILYTLFILGTLLPSLAVMVRRLHDIGKSGWWYFLLFVPIIGGIWLIVLLATDGMPGENQYGSNPKEIEVQ